MTWWEAAQTVAAMMLGFSAALVVLALLANWMINR
jgi:hypothetical protein